jgi:hypothetical protein
MVRWGNESNIRKNGLVQRVVEQTIGIIQELSVCTGIKHVTQYITNLSKVHSH